MMGDHEQMRERITQRLADLNVDAWIVVPDPSTGHPMQEQIPLSYVADAVLAALAEPQETRWQPPTDPASDPVHRGDHL